MENQQSITADDASDEKLKIVKLGRTVHLDLQELGIQLKRQEGTNFTMNDVVQYLIVFHNKMLPVAKQLRLQDLVGLDTNKNLNP